MNADNERRLMRAWLRGGESGSPVSRSRDGQECEGSKSVPPSRKKKLDESSHWEMRPLGVTLESS